MAKCQNCGNSVVQSADNFCTVCGTKLKSTCHCWVKKVNNYDCGEHSCPGYGLYRLEKKAAGPEEVSDICNGPPDGMGQDGASDETRKSHTCIAFHIQAFQRQATEKETADIAEPCKMCPYGKECDFAWYRYISRAIEKSRYRLTLAKGCEYLPEDISQ